MAKQGKLEGFVAVEDEEIEVAVQKYVDKRDARMKLTEVEVQARTGLIEVLKKHKRKAISINGYLVEVINEEKVRVRKASSKDDNEE